MNIIFFGNQKLVQGIKPDITPVTDILEQAGHKIIAHILTKEDLLKIPEILEQHPTAVAVLASFGYIVPGSIISLFEPLGILNIHPSLLPKYRGSTPIETAIASGDKQTGVSIMKIVKAMDAGDVYAQKTIEISPTDTKFTLAQKLTTLGAFSLVEILNNPSTPKPQSGTPTFTEKLTKQMSALRPDTKTATQLDREIRAFLSFPKSKITLMGKSCIILKAHPATTRQTPLDLKCSDNNYLIIDELLPENSKKMTALDFLNGHHPQ